MTNNYNAALYTDKESEYSKLNSEVLKNVSDNGRCNKCTYFKFGTRKCEKKDENGNLVRPDMIPVTYTEETSKGHFINVIKPIGCKDFTPKTGKKKNDKKGAETE